MQTLILSKAKLKMANCDNLNCEDKQKSQNLNLGLDFKFYQKLFVIIFMFSLFLIYPESPKDSEVICRKHHTIEACNIW